MNKLLQIVEETSSSLVETSEDKLKFSALKIKIWDYANLSQSDYQKFSIEDRSSILKKHFVDLSLGYVDLGKNCIFCL